MSFCDLCHVVPTRTNTSIANAKRLWLQTKMSHCKNSSMALNAYASDVGRRGPQETSRTYVTQSTHVSLSRGRFARSCTRAAGREQMAIRSDEPEVEGGAIVVRGTFRENPPMSYAGGNKSCATIDCLDGMVLPGS
jgi:hypothetical protein